MKRKGERRMKWGEGGLIAAALAGILVFSLAFYLCQMPRKVHLEPVHSVDMERLMQLERVDINSASAGELESLPGIGEGLAQRIIEYREVHGGFSGADELMNVEGIGEGKFEKLRGLIFVG